MDDIHTEFSNIMSNIHGEYSFILYDHKRGCVYFGRDPLGRRSLLMSKEENVKSVDEDEACSRVYLFKKQFIVSSVSLSSELQSSNTNDNEGVWSIKMQYYQILQCRKYLWKEFLAST